MSAVLASARAEWVRLRRPRMLLGTYGAVAVLTALFTSVVVVSAQVEAASTRPGAPPGAGVTLGQLAGAGGMTVGLTNAVALLGVVALSVAAAQVASGWTQGTLRSLLVRSPGRVRLLLGQTVAVVVFSAGSVIAAAAAGVGAAFALAPGQGVDTSAWTTSDGLSTAMEDVGLVALAVVGYSLAGVVLGSLLRSPVVAISAGAAWLLAVETVLAAVLDGADRWLPGQLLAAVATRGTADVALAAAFATVAGYLVAALAGALAAFRVRDVTA